MAAHPHAELMALYAKDAAETDEPWERWEWFDLYLNQWCSLNSFPSWSPTTKYRRKPDRPWYRVALYKNLSGSTYSYTADSASKNSVGYKEKEIEKHTNFVKWLTDRVYYDVE